MPGALHLTNTLSRKKELFQSMEQGTVKIFTCGPSVYRRAHIGNYRTFLYEDVLHRYLEYLGYRVQRVMNFTDVEDKAISEARKQGITLHKLTTPVEERFLKEIRMLGIKIPEIARSFTSVGQAVDLILSRLLSVKPNGCPGFATSSFLREKLERINGVFQILP
jgi:cysteinyl-tRNA synthetase